MLYGLEEGIGSLL